MNALESTFRKVLNDFGLSPKQHEEYPHDEENLTEYSGYQPAPEDYSPNDPIPVQIMNDRPQIVVGRGSRSWSSSHHFVTNASPVLIAGRIPRRVGMVIVNKGVFNVAIGNENNVKAAGAGNSNGNGELYQNDAITMNTIEEVWAICANSAGSDVMVYQFFEEGGAG